jgi:hypothetical protein
MRAAIWCKTAISVLPPTDNSGVGSALLSYAAGSDAAEFVVGGTTRTILSSMAVPVFISH